MIGRRRVAALAALALAAAACTGGPTTTGANGPSDPGTNQPVSTSTSACRVGVAWENRMSSRWATWDEPALRNALETAGAAYVATDAAASAETQLSDVDHLIAQGVRVLVINAVDRDAILPAVARATSQGIAVIAYDRLIDDPQVLYLSFDNVEVGRMQARAVLSAAPKGNYVFMKGDRGDANSDFLRSGQEEVLKAAVSGGDVTVVGDTYVDSWEPAVAHVEMIRFLGATGDKVDAVLAENDGLADGIMAALEEHHLAGRVALSGQDGDPTGLNRVALGTQTVDVWKDARLLGKAAASAAVELCASTAVGKVTGVSTFDTPKGNSVSSILLKPEAITRDNLKDVIDAGWIAADALCRGVKAGSVTACP